MLLILATLMVPLSVIMVPLYSIISALGLFNNLWGVILPTVATPTGVFLLRQYMLLDEVVLRSYATGAAHMALSWVSSEGVAVDDTGTVHDLTIRSFGVLRAVDTPPIEVELVAGRRPGRRGSDAVFVAVAAAAWLHLGCPVDWPTGARWR